MLKKGKAMCAQVPTWVCHTKYNLQNPDFKLSLPKTHTDYCNHNFSYKSVKIWKNTQRITLLRHFIYLFISFIFLASPITEKKREKDKKE